MYKIVGKLYMSQSNNKENSTEQTLYGDSNQNEFFKEPGVHD